MLRDALTEEELRALLGEPENDRRLEAADWNGEDRKLLHALVRNQLRLLHMIEELQSEVRRLKASSGPAGLGGRESAAGLEPLPLPFMRQSGGAGHADGSESGYDAGDTQKAPAAETSRKERYKRKSFW